MGLIRFIGFVHYTADWRAMRNLTKEQGRRVSNAKNHPTWFAELVGKKPIANITQARKIV
jgi:hypothetical protein